MKKYFSRLFFIFFIGSAYAQVNLTDAELQLIEKGLQKSYSIKHATYELAIDSLTERGIRRNFIPTLSMDGMYGYGAAKLNVDIPTVALPIPGTGIFEGDADFDAKGQLFNTGLTAKALLFSGMQVSYGSKATREKIKAKNHMLDIERADVIIEIVDTFDKITLLKKSEKLIADSELRLAREKKKVIKAIANGLTTPYDRDKIRAAELKLESKKTEVYGNLDLLYLKLEMLTGVAADELKLYDFELKPWQISESNRSFKDRPELQALEASIKAFDYKIKMNRFDFLPKVQAFASLSYFNLFDASLGTPYQLPISGEDITLELNRFRAFPAYAVGVGFHWDIFNGLKSNTEMQKSTIEKQIAEEKKRDAEEKLSLYAKKMQIDLEVKNKQIALKEKEKEVAYHTLNRAIKSYREGLITISERLEAEVDYQKAELEYYKMIAEQRKTALEMLVSTGSLNLENLK